MLFSIALTTAFTVLLLRHLALKRQIRNLTSQIDQLIAGTSEKMLDLSLSDRDLGLLACRLNRYHAMQRSAVAAAAHNEALIKEAVSDISHDLRTPLTVMAGHLQLLRKTPLTDSQIRRVETSLRKTCRMKELTEAFYELSVLDANQLQPRWEKINYSNLLMDFLTENAPLFKNRDIRPDIVLPDSSLFILTDRLMLERILQNLISNAVRYTAGEVTVTLTAVSIGKENLRPEEKAVLRVENTVRDTAGLDIDRLFDRFYSGNRTPSNESTGLGLAVAKLLAEKLGGELSAELCVNVLSVILIL